MKSCLDPSFEYTPSAKTDLKKTFARVRREQKASQPEAGDKQPAQSAEPIQLHARRAVG